ncbi:hypothetical protein Tco_1270221 [Tanacetum coccineum]
MYHSLNQLQWQLERDNFHGHVSKTCLVVLRTQFKEFFDSKEVNASDVPNKCRQKSFSDDAEWETKNFRSLLLQYLEELDKLIHERAFKYGELHIKESEHVWPLRGAAIEVCLVTEGATLEVCLLNEGIALNDNTEGNDTTADIGPLYDSDTLIEAPHSSNDTFEIGLGFENQNDYVNPSLLNKDKELAPCLYNIDKMGKDELSDHKIISEEESKCEAEKCLKVKQRKSPLSYHGFVYAETQFEEPQKFPLKQEFFKTQFESAISESYSRVYKNEMFKQNSALENENSCLKKTITQLQNDFSKMEAQSIAFEIALQHKIQENNSLKTIETENENFVASLQIENAHLKQTYKDLFESIQNSRDEPNQCDDVKLKFDFDEIETQNIELEHKVASLIKENKHLKLVHKNLFDSIKKSRVQIQSSNISQNEAKNLKPQLSEFTDKKFNQVFQKIESMKKKKFESRNSNDSFNNLCMILIRLLLNQNWGRKRFVSEMKHQVLKQILRSSKTKDFKDAKVDFSEKTDKFESYFEKLEKTKCWELLI